jgi:type IV pilus assembly protein PilV
MVIASLKTSRSASKGFTLVEVLMAMLIMAVGLLGLLQSVNVAYEHNARNKLREEAVLVAEEQMNDFRRMGFDSITANAVSNVRRAIVGRFRNFSVTRQYQTIPIGGDSKKLTVAVDWRFKNVKTEHVIYTMTSR